MANVLYFKFEYCLLQKMAHEYSSRNFYQEPCMGAIPQINSRLYADYLKRANGEKPGYLCQNKKTGNYALFFSLKDGPRPLPNYERLSFRDIVRLGIRFKQELKAQPGDASLVSKELQRMSDHREASQSKRNFLIRLAQKICDCVRNLFGGFGWKTTTGQARQLSKELEANLPKQQLAQPAQLPVTAVQVPSKEVPVPAALQAAQAPLVSYDLHAHVQTGHNEKAALATYKQNPANCTPQDMMTIWLNISKFEPTIREIANKQIASVQMLMEHMSASKKIDLNDRGCANVIVDSFRRCNKTTTSAMALWLIKQKNFSAPLLGRSLGSLSNRAKEKAPTDSYALYLLLKHYSTNKWNQILPCSNPQIVTAMETLLLEDHNAPNTIAMVKWIVDQKEFQADAFAALTRIFVHKAANNPATAYNTQFDALNHLLNWYRDNQGIKQQLQTNNPDVAHYLAGF